MQTATRELPSDPDQLRALLIQTQADLSAKDAELTAVRTELKHRDLELEKLKHELARLKRMRFGRSSEKLDQQIEEIETPALDETPETPAPARARPVRQPLSEHLPREAVVHANIYTLIGTALLPWNIGKTNDGPSSEAINE